MTCSTGFRLQARSTAAAGGGTGAAGILGTGAASSVATTATDYEADIQSFCCNISADDVKTEIVSK